MCIRDFELKDKDTVLKMAADFYHSPGVLHPIPIENFSRVYDEMCGGGSHRLRGILIEKKGQPVGFCSLSFSYSTEAGGPVVLLEEVYIQKEYRCQGLGSKLLQFLKTEYAKKAARLRLEVAPENIKAKCLYEGFGFETLPYVQMILEEF